ncbi:hypothetical protein [Xanthobacter versatilis]|uniref:hypothetical protein n=1 Tax=Xanthobacter autotrophicus (strain ATCC BAA-1158 / Py2) TaxID=78245 RepID=UPI003729B86F
MDPSINKTFSVILPHQMLRKLQWEIELLEEAIERNDLRAEFIIWNAATTALHIGEAAFHREPIRTKIKTLGFKTYSDFSKFIQTDSESLRVCRQIAINYRHAKIDVNCDIGLNTFKSIEHPHAGGRIKYNVAKNNIKYDIVDILKSAANWWIAFLHDKPVVIADLLVRENQDRAEASATIE